MTGETARDSNRTPKERLYDAFVNILVATVEPIEGKPPVLEAATLNVIRQFLKDSNITADDDKHEGLKDLKKHTLPFAERPNDGDA